MRRLYLAAMAASAFFLGYYGSASAEDCSASLTAELLNPASASRNSELGQGIACLAQPISVERSGVNAPTPDDIAAAKKIIILAGKIIGNGSPAAAGKGPKVITPGAPTVASVSGSSSGSGGASRQKSARSDQTMPLAAMIKCRTSALLGEKPPACQSTHWNKNEVIMASKLIGNG
ncbi:hypothetical protein FZ934_23795 (plasmid) [Rhizobium grahamii]|uniref:Uncharacterized protein n=1 Tax=Rhizobium grahamii TaxID=1120045 RepID=A0A5Q0CGI1_9HYPH|nr:MULTISPECIES: hypothetical protein [Rhizobium]QFY63310.1 hypothetical protein FZ934_23795 [Rhizobium grahamii]QRM51926.1 hypothetical protein F3Y33_21855 [Rhizobium sp. BG6]